ncbi:S41 family peptidase [Pedobacter nototheniae]|uniref:S41 family peptidase n=1 Tax=Pedobacter nototheniae TaxID=2488994 RepID=UPI00292CBC61|nr:S41 family peptidase [Pedobacter nototheniae]
MKRRFVLLFLTFMSLFATSRAGFNLKNNEDSLRNYLQTALDLMKKRSVNSYKINWDQIYREAYLAAGQAKTVKELYPIILQSLGKLGDHHSKFFPPEAVKDYVMGYRATGQKFPEIKSKLLKGKYAFISLPQFYSYNFDEWNEFADAFRAEVKQLEKQQPTGWIIDLRDNDGGMLAPMYAALASFVDQTQVIGWKDGAGKNHFIDYKNNSLYEDGEITHTFKFVNQEVKMKNKPVVVLVNRKTASSGEFAAALFVGQKNVTFVGTATNGLTSSNQEHQLPDGAFLVLTEGNLIDRNRKEYSIIGEGLQPDVKIEHLTNDVEENNQLYVEKAFEVINQKSSPKKPKFKGLYFAWPKL